MDAYQSSSSVGDGNNENDSGKKENGNSIDKILLLLYVLSPYCHSSGSAEDICSVDTIPGLSYHGTLTLMTVMIVLACLLQEILGTKTTQF